MSATAKVTELPLRETEIRPDELMRAQAERFEADMAQLRAVRDRFLVVDCPACDSQRRRPAFEKHGFSYVECADCATMYVSPRPTPEQLAHYYATSQNYAYWNEFIFPASEQVRREKIFRPRAERVAEIARAHRVRTDTLLEVGAGYGIFCEEMKRLALFQKVIGVEPTPSLAQTCRAKGIEIIEKPVEQVVLEPGRVDLIASFEVIEHLFSPRDFVAKCGELLGPGGLLVLTCPNGRGFDVALLKAFSSAVEVEHLNYFHPRSLGKLVGEHGFEVLETTTPGKLDAELARKSVLAGEVSLEGQPFLREVLVDRWDELGGPFQSFLAANGLSSHMWLVARKK